MVVLVIKTMSNTNIKTRKVKLYIELPPYWQERSDDHLHIHANTSLTKWQKMNGSKVVQIVVDLPHVITEHPYDTNVVCPEWAEPLEFHKVVSKFEESH